MAGGITDTSAPVSTLNVREIPSKWMSTCHPEAFALTVPKKNELSEMLMESCCRPGTWDTRVV